MCVDRARFGKLLYYIENAYLTGVDQFSKSVNNAYHHVTNGSNDQRSIINVIGPKNDGLSFAQASGAKNTGTKTSANPTTMQCYSCKAKGHKSYEFPNPKAPAVTAATEPNKTAMNNVRIGSYTISDSDDDDCNLEFSLYSKDQDAKEQTPGTRVLLENQSTIDIFFNDTLLVWIFTTMQVLYKQIMHLKV